MRSVASEVGTTTVGAVPVEIRQAAADDHDELYAAFSRIVSAGEGFPQQPPLTREEFDDYWIRPSAAVSVACFGGYLVGASYIKPNYVGRAAHIANAGYFVVAAYRGTGVGRSLVEHSLREARRLGFDAMMFNLVFESNPARAMYRPARFRRGGAGAQRRRGRGRRDLLAQPGGHCAAGRTG